ncbi:hypothetical protein IAT38_003224 [Cryptococcus sp. DSM 104549]
MDDMSSTGSNSTMSMKMYFHGTLGTDMLWFASWMPTSAGATVGVCIGLFLLAIFERYLIAFRRACDAAWRRGQIGYTRPTSTGHLPPATSSPTTGATTATAPGTLARRSSTLKGAYDPVSVDTEGEPVTPYTPGSAGSSKEASGSAPSYSAPPGSAELSRQGSAVGQRVTQEKVGEHSHLPRAVRRSLDPGREGRWSRPFRWAVDLPRGLLQSLQTLIHYLLMLVVMTFNIWWIIAVVVGSGVGEMLFGRFGSSHAGH